MVSSWEAMRISAATVRFFGCAVDLFICTWFFISFSKTIKEARLNSAARKFVWTKSTALLYICASSSTIGFTLQQMFSAIYLLQHDTLFSNILSSIISCTAIFSFMMFYVWRLYMSFQGSTYHLNKETIIMFITLSFLTTIPFITTQVAQITADENNKTPDFYGNMSIIIYMLLLAALMICIMYQFASRLLRLILSQTETSSAHMHVPGPGGGKAAGGGGGTSNDAIKVVHAMNYSISYQLQHSRSSADLMESALTDRQKTLLEAIAKQSALIQIAVLFIVFDCILLGIAYFTNDIFVYCTAQILLSIVDVVLVVGIWFSFAFAKKEYFFLCSKCHKFTRHWYGVLAMWQLSQQYQDQEINDEQDKKDDDHDNKDLETQIEKQITDFEQNSPTTDQKFCD